MAFATLLALASAAPAMPPPASDRAALIAELVAECGLAEPPSSDLAIVDLAGRVADPLSPDKFCSGHDRKLALKAAGMIADAPSSASAAAYGLLAAFHRGAHGMKPDAALMRLYARRAWLLGSRFKSPFGSEQQMRAYLADPETLAFLRDRLARGSPPRERLWLAEALLARRAGGDVEEARGLLRSADLAGEPAARTALAELALEPGAAPGDVADAAMRLRPLAASPLSGVKARPVIFRLAQAQLAAARSPDETWDAVQSLAAAAYAGEAEFLAAFRDALIAANGGVDPATVDAVAPRPQILPGDYPAWAMRRKDSGVVRLRALVDPRGRILFTESSKPDQSPVLVGIVRRIYASRAVPPLRLAKRPTPYVWVAIPPVTFEIVD